MDMIMIVYSVEVSIHSRFSSLEVNLNVVSFVVDFSAHYNYVNIYI